MEIYQLKMETVTLSVKLVHSESIQIFKQTKKEAAYMRDYIDTTGTEYLI